MTKQTGLPMRLALHAEGDKWNAYVANGDDMKGAIWIGSIAIAFVENNKARKDAFIALMTSALSDVIEEVLGQKPKWNNPTPAPDHERTRE